MMLFTEELHTHTNNKTQHTQCIVEFTEISTKEVSSSKTKVVTERHFSELYWTQSPYGIARRLSRIWFHNSFHSVGFLPI